jgi:IS4 transposase
MFQPCPVQAKVVTGAFFVTRAKENMRCDVIEQNFNMVAYLYKNRWQVEVFFKWIKQNLTIKKFWGIF